MLVVTSYHGGVPYHHILLDGRDRHTVVLTEKGREYLAALKKEAA